MNMLIKKISKPKELVEWKAHCEILIVRYIHAFMDILVIDGDGNVSTTKSFELDIYLKILSNSLQLKDISAPDLKRGLIYKTIFHLKKCKRQDIYIFRHVLAAEVRKYLRRPIQEYWILFPLHVRPESFRKFRSFSILGIRLHTKDWKYVHKHFEFQKFMDEACLHLNDVTISLEADFTPVIVHIEGRNTQEAFEKADRAFNLFRWLLNILPHFGRITHKWGGYPEPLGKIYPPPVYGVFRSKGEYEEYLFNTVKHSEYRANNIPGEQILSTRKLANRLHPPRGDDDTVLLIVEALEKYGQALDTAEWRLAFLVLWQILEMITLQSAEELSMKSVVNRINGLLRQDQLARDLLLALYDTRNALVHRWHFPDEQGLEEVNLIKYIAERSINALFSHLKQMPTTSSLARFYDHALTNDADLRDRARVIAYIQARRQLLAKKNLSTN